MRWTPLLLCACAAPRSVVPTADTGEPAPRCAASPVEIVAGIPGFNGRNGDGLPATETWLSLPQDATPRADGGFWIADFNNHLLRDVGSDGIAHIAAGTGFPSGGDGGPALEEGLRNPTAVLPDPHDPDALWFTASTSNRVGRLAIGAAVVSFPVGAGILGFAGDGGPANEASMWRPSSLGFDDLGNLYVSDRMNQVIRVVDQQGTITTYAGTPGEAGYTGDGGPASEATLNAVVEADPTNRLDVRGDRLVLADTDNHAIRNIDLTTGIITTLAAGFYRPSDVAIGADDTVYFTDTGNACVRAIAPDGAVRTIAGVCGVPGVTVAGAAPLDVQFAVPVGIAVEPDGRVWVTDRDNQIVVRFCE